MLRLKVTSILKDVSGKDKEEEKRYYYYLFCALPDQLKVCQYYFDPKYEYTLL